MTAYGQLEQPLDVPNKAVQDPWNQDEDIRIGKIGARGAFGDLAIGQMWMPYYNAIAYPVGVFLVGCFTMSAVSSVLGYFLIDWIWRYSVLRRRSSKRRARDSR